MIAVDTNLLIYAHRSGCPEHDAAQRALQSAANDAGGWGIPSPCILESWSVVTHPASLGGGSSPELARGFIEALMESGGAVVFPPPATLAARCMQLADQLEVRGSRIFDLQIGLTALEGRATEFWTHDRGFVAIPGLKVLHTLHAA